MEPTQEAPQIGQRNPSPTGCHTFISAAVERLTNIDLPFTSRKYLKMAGVPAVVPGTKFRETSVVPRTWSVTRGLIYILVAVALFVLGALGGSELERRRAVAEGAAEQTAAGITYIDGLAYRAVCMRDLKTWQDFQAISVREQAAELQRRTE